MPNPPLRPELAQEALDALAACGGNQSQAAEMLGIDRSTFMNRIRKGQMRGLQARFVEQGWTHSKEYPLHIDTGTVVVFSDAHFYPGEPTLANRALLAVIREVKPRAIVCNGDAFNGGSIGRHPPFGWAVRPSPMQELEACIERLGDIEQARPRGCELVFNIGNHELRWERTLATQVDKFAGLHGLRLHDHFPSWEFAWSCPINWTGGHPVMVKHRNAGGIHSGYNDALRSGVSIVTGHTHGLSITPFGDYRGRRWGIKTGSLADLHGPQFEYHENGPSPACSGFAVLTFQDGILIPPELCECIDGRAWFRGEVVAHD